MSAETFLSEKLRRFDVVEYMLVMMVYFVVGLWIASCYPPLRLIGWWFYLLLIITCAFPLIIHLISQPGDNLQSKFSSCVKSNAPSLQVLLFLAMLFTSCVLVSFVPILTQVTWWMYLTLIVILSLKPLKKTWFW